MVSVTINSVKPVCCASHSNNNLGIIPITFPPFAKQPLATAPIKPLLPPPYTICISFSANKAPIAIASFSKCGLFPDLEPQNMVTAFGFIEIRFKSMTQNRQLIETLLLLCKY